MNIHFLRHQFGVFAGLALVGLLTFSGRVSAADTDQCFVCGAAITGAFYRVEDKVTLEKRNVCKDCETSLPVCFVCGLPAGTSSPGRQQLSDGRTLCARDAQTAILQADEGKRVCREVWEKIDRLFSRFISFPENNVTIRIVDRVHLLELFKLAGNDYECPNVLGFTQTKALGAGLGHQVSVLGGMPLDFFQATCAHEFTHTWLNENLTESRRKTLSKDAEEAFCELVSYLLMDSLGNAEAKARLLHNGYTRGQINAFVSAEQQFGFNDVVEWMKSGADERLDPDHLDNVRNVVGPKRTAAPAPVAIYVPVSAPVPRTLALKAVFWDQTRPTALINDHTFGVNETGTVRIGETNLTLRCVAIRKDGVRVQIPGSNQEQELVLRSR